MKVISSAKLVSVNLAAESGLVYLGIITNPFSSYRLLLVIVIV